MPTFDAPVIFWIALFVQCLGIISLVGARLSEKTWGHTVFCGLFYVSFLAVGLATMLTFSLEHTSWLSCATILGVMSVGATLDCSSDNRTAEVVC